MLGTTLGNHPKSNTTEDEEERGPAFWGGDQFLNKPSEMHRGNGKDHGQGRGAGAELGQSGWGPTLSAQVS